MCVCVCVCVSRSVVSDSSRPHGLQPARLLRPWNSPGKDTGAGCRFLLQGIFPTQGSKPGLLHCRQIFLPSEPPGKPSKAIYVIIKIIKCTMIMIITRFIESFTILCQLLCYTLPMLTLFQPQKPEVGCYYLPHFMNETPSLWWVLTTANATKLLLAISLPFRMPKALLSHYSLRIWKNPGKLTTFLQGSLQGSPCAHEWHGLPLHHHHVY